MIKKIKKRIISKRLIKMIREITVYVIVFVFFFSNVCWGWPYLDDEHNIDQSYQESWDSPEIIDEGEAQVEGEQEKIEEFNED
ncbi:MAG: hypothetical protein ACOC5T_09925, partial [Elusimicrobiota bacterium]